MLRHVQSSSRKLFLKPIHQLLLAPYAVSAFVMARCSASDGSTARCPPRLTQARDASNHVLGASLTSSQQVDGSWLRCLQSVTGDSSEMKKEHVYSTITQVCGKQQKLRDTDTDPVHRSRWEENNHELISFLTVSDALQVK